MYKLQYLCFFTKRACIKKFWHQVRAHAPAWPHYASALDYMTNNLKPMLLVLISWLLYTHAISLYCIMFETIGVSQTWSIDRSTMSNSHVSFWGKSGIVVLYLERQFQTAAASFVGTKSRCVVVTEASRVLAAR